LDTNDAKYSSEGVFDININGDGYDIDVFNIPEEYVNYIINNFEKIKSEYPKHNNGLYPYKPMESVHWKETPIDDNEKIIHDEIIGNENCRTQGKIAYCIYQETGILAYTKRQFLTHLICLPQKRQVQHKQYTITPFILLFVFFVRP